MKTFAPPREFQSNTEFQHTRLSVLSKLNQVDIDPPIKDLIYAFADLPHCFTLQSCHGHFVCGPDDAHDNNDPIPAGYTGKVNYRIAYVALCIENSERGHALRDALSLLTEIDTNYVQFGSPGWFWDQWINSYTLQVEPKNQQFADVAQLDVTETRQVEHVRDIFFQQLRQLVEQESVRVKE